MKVYIIGGIIIALLLAAFGSMIYSMIDYTPVKVVYIDGTTEELEATQYDLNEIRRSFVFRTKTKNIPMSRIKEIVK